MSCAALACVAEMFIHIPRTLPSTVLVPLALLAWLVTLRLSSQACLTTHTSTHPTQQNGTVVIVHLGAGERVEGIPLQQSTQLVDNVEQLRLFNPFINVIVVVDPLLRLTASEASRLAAANAELVATDTLPTTPQHQAWLNQSKIAQLAFRNKFWRYATERFFFLSGVAIQRNLKNIVHIVSHGQGKGTV